MDNITAIHSLEQLSATLVPGSEESKAVQVAIENLWKAVKEENRKARKEQALAMAQFNGYSYRSEGLV